MAKEQVELFDLVFTHNWEDPESDHEALKIQSGNTVFAITSGGCNILGFLLRDPSTIYSVDINPTQNYLLELKIAAIKCLSFDEFISFSGLKSSANRIELYQKLRTSLSKKSIEFWDRNQSKLKQGFIMNGKYERFIRLAGKFINLLQGKKRTLALFQEKTIEDQVYYFEHRWNTKRFKLLFKILFNKRILAKRGLVSDYFHFDDGSKSFAESFYNRSRKVFRNITIKGNYFLSLYLLGRYQNDTEVPEYLKGENYDIIKSRINRIKLFTSEAQSWLDSMPEESIDCFSLSNICELMSEKDTGRLFTGVFRTSRKDGRVIFRNLMIPRDVPIELKDKIVINEKLSRKLFENDRSFVYGKVAAYSIRK